MSNICCSNFKNDISITVEWKKKEGLVVDAVREQWRDNWVDPCNALPPPCSGSNIQVDERFKLRAGIHSVPNSRLHDPRARERFRNASCMVRRRVLVPPLGQTNEQLRFLRNSNF